MPAERLVGVGRARGVVLAGRGERGRDEELVGAHEQDEWPREQPLELDQSTPEVAGDGEESLTTKSRDQ